MFLWKFSVFPLTLRLICFILYTEVITLNFGHQNICKFIPPSDTDQDINVLNFVYEANWKTTEKIYKTGEEIYYKLDDALQDLTESGKKVCNIFHLLRPISHTAKLSSGIL